MMYWCWDLSKKEIEIYVCIISMVINTCVVNFQNWLSTLLKIFSKQEKILFTFYKSKVDISLNKIYISSYY